MNLPTEYLPLGPEELPRICSDHSECTVSELAGKFNPLENGTKSIRVNVTNSKSYLPYNNRYRLGMSRDERIGLKIILFVEAKGPDKLPLNATYHLHSVDLLIENEIVGQMKKLIEHRNYECWSIIGLPDETLTKTHSNHANGTIEIRAQLHFLTHTDDKNIISRSLYELKRKQIYCDVFFKLNDGSLIGAHVAILSARSNVFRDMFKNWSQTGLTSERIIPLERPDPRCFDIFLNHVYSGETIERLTVDTAIELYGIAEEYQVEDLMKETVGWLTAHVTKKNAIRLLVFSHRFSVSSLLEVCLKNIKANKKYICSSEEWVEFTRRSPDLCVLATRRMLDITIEEMSTQPEIRYQC